MTATEREREFYKGALEKAQEGPESTGYGAAINQKVRFDALLQHRLWVDVPKQYRLLDVGCGTGDLLDRLMKEEQRPAAYMGVDRLPEMVWRSKQRFQGEPGFEWVVGEVPDCLVQRWIRSGPGGTAMFDVSVSIATWAMKPEDWGLAEVHRYVQKQVDWMVNWTNTAVFVTLFSTWKNNVLPDEMNTDPLAMLAWALTRYKRVELIHSYAPHDYALVIQKDEGEWWRSRT